MLGIKNLHVTVDGKPILPVAGLRKTTDFALS